jgi:RNA polymerase sigma-32 factor
MMFITRRAAMEEPMLSVDQEREAVLAWQQRGDRAALELLIRSHARQVYAQAARWSDNPSHIEDMVAEGMIGLMRAADKFDLEQDVRFSTYASWWVLNGVSSALVKIKTVIDIPVRTYLDASGGRLDSEKDPFAQIAVQNTIDLGAEAEGGIGLTCPNPNPEEHVAVLSEAFAQRRMLEEALVRLDPDDAGLIRRLRLDDPPARPEDLAGEMGISSDRVRQLEGRALSRLRKRLMENGFGLEALS